VVQLVTSIEEGNREGWEKGKRKRKEEIRVGRI
jgi:hypothetical protein